MQKTDDSTLLVLLKKDAAPKPLIAQKQAYIIPAGIYNDNMS